MLTLVFLALPPTWGRSRSTPVSLWSIRGVYMRTMMRTEWSIFVFQRRFQVIDGFLVVMRCIQNI